MFTGDWALSLSPGLERDKFDNKTVTFEEHIKEEHNMWHYLCFIVLVKVKDSTEYTGPESYVAEMIKVSGWQRSWGKVTLGPAGLAPWLKAQCWRQWGSHVAEEDHRMFTEPSPVGLCVSSEVIFRRTRQVVSSHFKGGSTGVTETSALGLGFEPRSNS